MTHHIFRHYLINGSIFGKKSLNIKCVFWFSLQLLFETLLILRIIQGDIVNNVKSLHVKHSLFLSDFNKTWILSTNFRKSLNNKFYTNPSSGSRVVRSERTDWRRWQALFAVLLRRLQPPRTYWKQELISVTRNWKLDVSHGQNCRLGSKTTMSPLKGVLLRWWMNERVCVDRWCRTADRLAPVCLHPPRIKYGGAWVGTRVSTVTDRRLTAWKSGLRQISGGTNFVQFFLKVLVVRKWETRNHDLQESSHGPLSYSWYSTVSVNWHHHFSCHLMPLLAILHCDMPESHNNLSAYLC